MKNVKSALLVIAALGAISTAAVAGDGRQIPAACQADAAKLCPGMTPGDHKFGPCMREHKEAVSDACKAVAKKFRDNHGKPGQPGGPSTGVKS
jgi:hypothetical protein